MAQGSSGGALIAAALILGGSLLGGSYLVAGSIDGAAGRIAELNGAIQTAAAARPAAAPARRGGRPDPNRVYRVDVAGAPYRGNEKAAITVVEWSDFQ